MANGGISIFASQIITKFGFSTARSALLGMCQGVAEVVAVAIGTALFVCFGRRDLPSIFGYIVAVVGGILMVAVSKENKNTQMAGMSRSTGTDLTNMNRTVFGVFLPHLLPNLLQLAEYGRFWYDKAYHIQRQSASGLLCRQCTWPRSLLQLTFSGGRCTGLPE